MPDSVPTITAEINVKLPVAQVWKLWTTPSDIMIWNNPSDAWHNLLVEVDLKDNGNFLFRMQAKDGNDGFDYCGKYNLVKTNEIIKLTTTDGRKTTNIFTASGEETTITEIFEPDTNIPADLQKEFCQNILNSFKSYAEKSTETSRITVTR